MIALKADNPLVLLQTVKSMENYNFSAMDAIHIGSAIALKCDNFISADRRQLDAAQQAGLNVEAV